MAIPKPQQLEMASKLKMLNFTVTYNVLHNSYIGQHAGYTLEIFSGVIIGWNIAKENRVLDYSIASILEFIEEANEN